MITEERRNQLMILVEYIRSKIDSEEIISLNFICTHNSRRSHLAQTWAQIAAAKNGIRNVHCYSGGTEATAMFPMIAETLQNQGLQLHKLSHEANPVYGIRFDQENPPIIAFSKKYDHPYNPSSNFAAIMTCDHADENCPLILGSEARISITYVDPKISDGTEEQKATYLQRSEQIKAEMDFVFETASNKVKEEHIN